MNPIPLFVELCAGTAALSLRLHRDGARPPVSRMGAKTGYADVILRILGLRPGQRAQGYLWCEPDAGVRLLLAAYADGALARAAADIIRGWAGEDPRALWERLRAEGPVRDEGAGEVARWAHLQGVGVNGKGPDSGFGGWFRPFKEHGEVVRMWAQDGEPVKLSGSLDTLPTLPAAITPDARAVDPREVARWMFQAQAAYRRGQPESGFDDKQARGRPGALAALMGWAVVSDIPALTLPDARAVDPGPDLPPGTVVYMDPPYQNTTGYGHALGRPEVVALARRWADAGATVCISEAEPIPELVADGWHAVRIDGERVGQKRTFSKQQAEWVTLNRPPAWVPPKQGSLF